MCVSGYMPKKIRVDRSENLFFFWTFFFFFFFYFFFGPFFFFFFFTLIDVRIIMHDQGIERSKIEVPRIILLLINEVVDSFYSLELKLLGIRYTPYCAHTGQIPIKIHFSMTFSSRVSSDRLRYNKKC